MSIQLNPSEVLAHLNRMGYRNINQEQLKEFMTDLKRLIKYESRYSLQSPTPTRAELNIQFHKNAIPNQFEKLYKTSTEATRARLSARTKKIDKENDNPYDPDKFDRKIIGEPSPCPKKQTREGQVPSKHKCSTNQLTQPSRLSKENCMAMENEAKMTHPPRASSAPLSMAHYIRNTPTDLYQKYQREWSRFKHLLPGENTRASERQVVRKRMENIQKFQSKPKVYVQMNDDNTKVIKCIQPPDFH